MNVLIIEDEPTAARRLERLIKKFDSTTTILEKLDSVESSVKWLQENPAADLILMDIKLADGLCFEIFKKVEVETPVIFCTAYDSFAIKAFNVNSVGYLLKPINEEALHASLDKFNKFHNKATRSPLPETYQKLLSMMSSSQQEIKDRFLVKFGRRFLSVPVDKIALFYTENKIVRLVTMDNKQYPFDLTLDELERCLDPKLFFRTNRQSILAVHAIQSVVQDYGSFSVQLNLSGHDKVLVSRKRINSFKQWMGG
jgi:two-component system, LytTR family, response regulator LytT